MDKQKIELSGAEFSFSDEQEESANWLPFKGTCLFTDMHSRIPSNSDKPVVFPHEEIIKAQETMLNKGVDCVWSWNGNYYGGEAEDAFTGHNDRFKIGTVTKVETVGNEMKIEGGLWSLDFFDVCQMYTNVKSTLGFSVEVLFNAEDAGDHYIAHDVEFTGVAILYAGLAAFDKTYIAAKAKEQAALVNKQNNGGNNSMDEKQMKEILSAIDGVKAELSQQVTVAMDKVNALDEKVSARFKAMDDEKAKVEAKAKAEAEKQAAELAAKEKEQAELAAKAEQEKKEQERKSLSSISVLNRFAEGSKQAQIVNDPNMSAHEKFQALLAAREVEND